MKERISQAQAYRLFPALPKGLTLIADAVDEVGLAQDLICLLEIRASQINGCGFCLDMHLQHARDLGEDQQRLDVLSAWREVPWFNERERAALQLCELLTDFPSSRVTDDDYANLKQHFSELEIIALTATILKINSWNRVVATLHFIPERKEQIASSESKRREIWRK